ncbi:MAG TPA: hypothetical protein VF699_03260 [Caulobacteraceae bacterium]
MTDQDIDPAEALEIAGRARAGLAERNLSPWWYAPVYGAGVGVSMSSFGLTGFSSAAAAVGGLAVVLSAYAVWSRSTGVSVHGFRAGKPGWIAAGLVLFLLGVSAAGLWLRARYGYDWAPFAAAAVAAAGAAIGSRLWDAAWLAQLRAGR